MNCHLLIFKFAMAKSKNATLLLWFFPPHIPPSLLQWIPHLTEICPLPWANRLDQYSLNTGINTKERRSHKGEKSRVRAKIPVQLPWQADSLNQPLGNTVLLQQSFSHCNCEYFRKNKYFQEWPMAITISIWTRKKKANSVSLGNHLLLFLENSRAWQWIKIYRKILSVPKWNYDFAINTESRCSLCVWR